MASNASFAKLLNHPDKQRIIEKLVNGDPAKTVSEYLKVKYDGPDQAHLRISAAVLSDFKNQFMDRYQFLNKMVKEEEQGKLNKKVFDSLLDNKAWRERIADFADKEIDLKRTVQQVIHVLMARAEQVYDAIQTNPKLIKHDYALIKYFSTILDAVEKADKVVNERPDTLIQNNISISVIEQQSVMLQEAIREVLVEMDPELSAYFMDRLTEKMSQLESEQQPIKHTDKSLDKNMDKFKKMLPADIEDLEAEDV